MRSTRRLVKVFPVCSIFFAAGCHHAVKIAFADQPNAAPKPDFRTKARQSLHTFLKELRTPAHNQEYFSVAVPGRLVGANKDSVWVDGLKVNGDLVEGRLVSCRGSAQSDSSKRVKFQCGDVCDWMIVADNRVEGAFSLR